MWEWECLVVTVCECCGMVGRIVGTLSLGPMGDRCIMGGVVAWVSGILEELGCGRVAM